MIAYNIDFEIKKNDKIIEEGFDTLPAVNLKQEILDFVSDMEFDDTNEVKIQINRIEYIKSSIKDVFNDELTNYKDKEDELIVYRDPRVKPEIDEDGN